MENKEIAVVGSSFVIVIALALFMYISQQKNNNVVKETIELKEIIEKNNEELKATNTELKSAIDSINARLDETDERFHKQ